jgi:hypothetical protein
MPPLRTYGTKRSTTSSAAAAIFGREVPASRRPLADLTSQFSNINIDDNEGGDDSRSVEDESSVVSAHILVESGE